MIDFHLAERELAEPGIGLRERWRRAAGIGVQGWTMPRQFGGAEADARATALAMEGLGYACEDGRLIGDLNAQVWGCQHPLARLGTDDQRRRHLPGLIDGSLIAARATIEPDAGPDALALATTARPRGDRYVLEGTKTHVAHAGEADLLLVLARLRGTHGIDGLCTFLVERDAPGLHAANGDVFLERCEVPASALLGRPGDGMAALSDALELGRIFLLAATVGAMDRELEAFLRYDVSDRVADMKLRVETARLLVHRIAWLIDRDQPIALETALLMLHMRETPDVQRAVIARLLGQGGSCPLPLSGCAPR